MSFPLEINFHNLDRSAALEARVRELADRLVRFSPHINHFHVTLERPHRHQHQGNHFETSLRILMPGNEIVIRGTGPTDHEHEDPYVSLRDAFKAARRKLQDYERQRRGDVKTHVEPLKGRICEIDTERNFGRIETDDGRLIYFHRNSVLGRAFEDLEVGAQVRFAEEPGDLGPQASSVHA
jgi:cold shock CspA family protein/ribosome-associated translation inhibitor RaiA